MIHYSREGDGLEEKTKIYNIIKDIFLFKNIDETIIQKTAESGELYITNFNAGEVIYETSSENKSVGFVLSGNINISTASKGKTVVINKIKKGGIFGAASVFGKNENIAKIISKNKSKILFIPKKVIIDLFKSDYTAAINYIDFLSGRIRFLNEKIASFTAGNAESRLAVYILNLLNEKIKSNEKEETEFIKKDEIKLLPQIYLPVALKPLSESLDIGRASLYRAFNNLEKSGCIIRSERNITIISKTELEKFL